MVIIDFEEMAVQGLIDINRNAKLISYTVEI